MGWRFCPTQLQGGFQRAQDRQAFTSACKARRISLCSTRETGKQGLTQTTMKSLPPRQRLIVALGMYAVLAVIALAELDGLLRGSVLLLLALLAGKTLAHADDEPME
jgi:hypothetical protein